MRPVLQRVSILVVLLAVPLVVDGQVPFDPDRNQAIGVTAGLASGAGPADSTSRGRAPGCRT